MARYKEYDYSQGKFIPIHFDKQILPMKRSCGCFWKCLMRKYDKSLIEVWEWKEKIYNEVKNLSATEYVEEIRKGADKILSDSQIKLTAISVEAKHRKAV